jgi:uncharacterized protein
MTRPDDDDLRERLRRALPAAMKARDRPALAALRSALGAIDNAEAVDAEPDGWEIADPDADDVDAVHPGFAGTVAGVGATEVERRSLSAAQMEDIVRAEIEGREIAAAALERGGQREQAERLRAEVSVLLSHVTRT